MSGHQGEESSSRQGLEKEGGEEGWRDARNAAEDGKAPRISTKLRIIPLVSETRLWRDRMVHIRSGDGVKGGR